MAKSKELIVGIIIIVVIVAIVILALHIGKKSNILQDGQVLDAIHCSKLNKVVVIHKLTCQACTIALSRLHELERELNMTFTYYDIAMASDKQKVLDLDLVATAVPVVIANCNVMVGLKTKDEYKNKIIS